MSQFRQSNGSASVGEYVNQVSVLLRNLQSDVIGIRTDVDRVKNNAPTNGSLVRKGNWDALSNNPSLSNNGVGGKQGDYYVVNVGGTTSVDSINIWGVNDWILNTGSKWEKLNNSGVAANGILTANNIVNGTQTYTSNTPITLNSTSDLNNVIDSVTDTIITLPLNPANGTEYRILNYGVGTVTVTPQSPNIIEQLGVGTSLTLETGEKIVLLYISNKWNMTF